MQRAPLTTMTDLVEVVPTLFGFHVHDSIVLIAIEDGHLVFSARADLGEDSVPYLSLAWIRHPGAQHVLIAYSEDEQWAWAELHELGLAIPDGVTRTLVHADGQTWSERPFGEGTPYDALGSIHLARAAYEGRPVRASRDELYRLVEPSRTPEEVTASIERVATREDGLGDVLGDALALVAGHDDAPGDLDIDDATVLCLATHAPDFLETALLSTTCENASRRLGLWLQVVGASVPNCAGGALVAAGLAAWLSGDGALLSVCLETMQGRPGPAEWAGLLDAISRDAVPPREWQEIAADLVRRREAVQVPA